MTSRSLFLGAGIVIACLLLLVAEPSLAQQYYPQYSQPQYSTPYSSAYPIADEGISYDSPRTSTSELGLRYLKLGNSYRESRNYDMAQYYIQRGYDLVRGRGSRYWEGVANEYSGLVYRDIGDRATALEYLRRAESIYRSVISPLRSESSIDAAQKVLSDVEYGWRYLPRPTAMENYRWYSDYPYYNRSLTARYSSAAALEKERLQRTNLLLQSQLSDLESRLRQLEQPVYYGR